ncbi:hypothetical protein Tco_0602882, partial [Tanacetum coccineum]
MKYDELFTEFNQLLVKEAEVAEDIRLRAEVQTLADRNTVLEGEKSESASIVLAAYS